jgi:hypothetical protein
MHGKIRVMMHGEYRSELMMGDVFSDLHMLLHNVGTGLFNVYQCDNK